MDSMIHDGLTCPFSKKSMGEIADALAKKAGISRDAQDRFALESHRRAVAASEAGEFTAEVVPVPSRQASEDPIARDEGPRADTDLAKLARLKPAFGPDTTITAGNSSMISDGAAAVVVANESAAARIGKQPLARIVASATSGGEPQDLFTAPIEAVRRVVAKAGIPSTMLTCSRSTKPSQCKCSRASNSSESLPTE